MKRLWFYLVCWKHRNMLPYEFMEQYMLILKAARRCAYDLKHAGGDLQLYTKNRTYSWYTERAEMWQNLFTPQGGKDYRHELHKDIIALEIKVSRLEELCEKHNIDLPYEKIPF